MIVHARSPRSKLVPAVLLCALTLALLAVLASSASAAEGGGAWWRLTSSSTPTYLAPGGEGTVVATATNSGYENVPGATSPVTIKDRLPADLEATGATPVVCPVGGPNIPVCAYKWPQSNTLHHFPACTVSVHEVSCTLEETLAPFEQWELDVNVKVSAALASGATDQINEVLVEGGALAPASFKRMLQINSAATPFGVEDVELAAESPTGAPEAQAGAHPFQFTTTVAFNRDYNKYGNGYTLPSVPEATKDVRVDLPPGFVGDAVQEVVPRCTELQFSTVLQNNTANQCPANTAIGVAVVSITEPGSLHNTFTLPVPVFNLTPSPGEPARFGFMALSVPVTLDTVDNGGDYHIVVNVHNASEEPALFSSQVTIWGVPGEARHDAARGWGCVARGAFSEGQPCTPPSPRNTLPFLTLPTSCPGEPLRADAQARSWTPGAAFTEPFEAASAETLTGCGSLPFDPEVSITPTEEQASTPTGLAVVLKVPQTTTLEEKGLAEANLKNSKVILPAGFQLSPSAANGLTACSEKAVGFAAETPDHGVNPYTHTLEFLPEEAKQESAEEEAAKEAAGQKCPNSSKVGTVTINTPILEHELHGSVYLAEQTNNPFGSLFALYIVVKDPNTGVDVKLAGEVHVDENTGQITTTFANAPQLPFHEFKLELFNGPRASIATPANCGSAFTAVSVFEPWSATSAVTRNENLGVSSCPNAGAFTPGFSAGTTNPQAGEFTPFTLTLTRPSGQQQVTGLQVSLPPGISGMLSKVEQCPEPQASQGTCGPRSLIGSATAVVGLGSDPYTETGGRVYITGPYGGAPFGLSIVIPAETPAFHFGNVVTRSTINVNRETAALTIGSTLPTFVNTTTYHTGVPVQLRSVTVTVQRPGNEPFQFNPTNCAPMNIVGTVTGEQKATATLTQPFQAKGCDKLAFSPKLSVETNSQYTRTEGTNLSVVVEAVPGQANIAKTKLVFPLQLPSRLTTLQKACLASVFNVNPAACSPESIIGTATAHTPVLNSALSGPIYLVATGGAEFPDAIFVLQGEGITLYLDGKTNIHNGITSSTFNAVPDAPISRFEVSLPKGPHSAFTGYENLCEPTSTATKRVLVTVTTGKGKHRKKKKVYKNVTVKTIEKLKVPAILTGQNGDVVEESLPMNVKGCATSNVQSFKKKKAPKKKAKKHKKKKK